MQKPEMILIAAMLLVGVAAAVYLGYFAPQARSDAIAVQQNTSQDLNAGDGMANTVVIETSKGTIEVELDAAKAPGTVKNFLEYANAGFYDGTIFHRVIPGFMVQGGGFTPDGSEKDTSAPIKLEAGNGLKNLRGTIAMARTNDPDSATSQFFINLKDNDFLNAVPGSDGYAVFGKVVKGMEVVDAIAKVQTTTKGYNEDWPVQDVVINKVSAKK